MPEKKLVRTNELVELTGITRYQLRKFLKAGVLVPVRLPGMYQYYYRISEVRKILGGNDDN
jgi:DNA-binding transcriptional MerR regulator